MYKKLQLVIICLFAVSLTAQTNAPSIQSGVTFQWSDNQTAPNQPATIESITVNGNVYFSFGVPTAYELTQLGPNGHPTNNILRNGTNVETTSASPTWNATALEAFQSLNLFYYFEANGNGQNICDDYVAEQTTTSQRFTLFYEDGIVASSSGVIAVTEQNANNCYHIEFFGIPEDGGPEQSLGETFVNDAPTQWGFGGTGTGGPNGLGTPGAINPPPAGSDYWLSDRVVKNRATLGIAVFYLDDIAPTGSLITKATLTAATADNGDGKMFILTLPDHDKDGMSDVDDLDDDNDGIKDLDESGGIDPSLDDDLDGIPNYQDADFCTLNASGVCINLDFDSDGIPNHFDLDSDNDGITDVFESGGTDTNPAILFDQNDGKAFGKVGKTPTRLGLPASAGTGTVPINTDGVDGYNFLDLDSDNDGIPDQVEGQRTMTYVSPSGLGPAMTDANGDGYDDDRNIALFPVDTDFDRVHDYVDTDSDNDGIPDIEENGMPNTLLNVDTDGDGLDDRFEGANLNDASDVNDEIDNPSASILPDTDGDLGSSGDLDYRDLFNVNPPVVSTIDFDGVDDYLSGNSLMVGAEEFTVMAWVLIDPSNSGNARATILGEGNASKLYVQNGNTLMFSINTDLTGTQALTGAEINYNEWHHITGVFSSITGEVSIYVDGELQSRIVEPTLIGSNIQDDALWNQNFEVGRLSKDVVDKEYFVGNIDEVRVFDIKLTEDLIHQMVYQEIEENSGFVIGKVVPKSIEDRNTEFRVPWANLVAYYPMTDIKNNTTLDHGSGANFLRLMNITTVQEQTAPMPYETVNDGDWTSESTWLHGDVWDIDEVGSNKDWSIVKIKNNITTNSSHANLGLIVDSGKTFTVNGEHKVENNWYFELNGTLDLRGDSQLIQTINSDLVTSANGKLLRRQEGVSNKFRYNYWASPIGTLGVSTLIDNNTDSNNTNNNGFRLNMLRQPNGSPFQFTSALDAVGKISTYWTYTFINGITYYDWAFISPGTTLQPGIGYTQKGTGVSSDEQQYLFEGKPNNGTIVIAVDDVGGSGSVPTVSKTDFLLGNPYASAIDIHKFIDDNVGIIDGTIQLWQQWSGDSHYLDEYDGGYAQVNKLGSIRAYQFVGIAGANNGNQDGTKTPTRYLPVGQGFITEIVNSGNVVFKNSQRVFVKESDADDSYENGSVFFRGTPSSYSYTNQSQADAEEQSVMQKIRLEFNAIDGPDTRRELLLGFSDFTSDAHDYGYEAKNLANNDDDLSLELEGQLMTMQAYGPISDDKSVKLVLNASGSYNYAISLTQTENIPEGTPIYIKDNHTGEYYDLTAQVPFEFSSDQGQFTDRFEIVFQEEQQGTLSQQDELIEHLKLYYAQGREKLVVLNPEGIELEQIEVFNMLGQVVYANANVFNQSYNEYQLSNLTSGSYVVRLQTKTDQALTKKIIVN